MTTEIANAQNTDLVLPTPGIIPDEDKTPVPFLPYLICVHPMSDYGKANPGDAKKIVVLMQKEALVAEDELDVIHFDWQFKAMAMDKGMVTAVYLDKQSPEFEDIIVNENRKQFWGYECLTWVPKIGKFVTTYYHRITARRHFENDVAPSETSPGLISVPITLKHRMVPNNEHGPYPSIDCVPCHQTLVRPSQKQLDIAYRIFKNPLLPQDKGGEETETSSRD